MKAHRKDKKPVARGPASKPKETPSLPGIKSIAGPNKWFLYIALAVFAFVLYGNTINHDYTLDDDIITRRNAFVQEGTKGIGKIFSYGYLYGFNKRNDQSYRPVTLASIAIEKQIWGSHPHVHHFFNVLFYALTGIVLLLLLRKLFRTYHYVIPLIITALFLAHPVHTEVVANIKSRDEILGLFFTLLGLNSAINYIDRNKQKDLILGGVFFLAALLSKESVITFVAVAPLTFWFFRDVKLKNMFLTAAPWAAAAAVYLLLRKNILTSFTFDEEMIKINNSLMAASPGMERFATGMLVMGKYVLLLFFPHPLSYDYSFKQIPVVNMGDTQVIVTLLVYTALGVYGLIGARKKDPVAFGILYFLICMSVVSNLFIKIGSSMGERFLYTPSLGFCIALVIIVVRLLKIKTDQPLLKSYSKLYTGAAIVLLLFTVKTIGRSADWKNNFTLFSTDVHKVPNSARAHSSLAYEYTEKAKAEPLPNKRKEYFDSALAEYKHAIEILPDFSEGWYNLGYCYYLMGDRLNAAEAYRKTIEADSLYSRAYNNLGVIYFEDKNYPEALKYFFGAVKADSLFADAYGNIGASYHNMGDYTPAVQFYEKALSLNPGLTGVANNLEGVRQRIGK